MRSKILFAAGLILAFVLGTVASGIYSATSKAFNPPDEDAVTPVRTVRTSPAVVRTRYVEPRTVIVEDSTPAPVVRTRNRRSWEKEVLIVGGSAGAGAAIGAVAGGKKGAGIGALSGGIAGFIYDMATRNK